MSGPAGAFERRPRPLGAPGRRSQEVEANRRKPHTTRTVHKNNPQSEMLVSLQMCRRALTCRTKKCVQSTIRTSPHSSGTAFLWPWKPGTHRRRWRPEPPRPARPHPPSWPPASSVGACACGRARPYTGASRCAAPQRSRPPRTRWWAPWRTRTRLLAVQRRASPSLPSWLRALRLELDQRGRDCRACRYPGERRPLAHECFRRLGRSSCPCRGRRPE
mmetsp:Transcript_2585/g.7471  ORF Transcript_2585/g.7471 Transcript_2585/m.7471 type:complete len:218 (-) Transcript_2585:100-753(-)